MLKLNRWCIGVSLILAIVFPTVFILPKLILLVGVVACTTHALLSREIAISLRWALAAVLYSVMGLSASLYGVIVGAPGALRVLTVMAIYPILFTIIAFTYEHADARRLSKIFVISAWLLIAVDLAYIISNLLFPYNSYAIFLEELYLEGAVIDNADSYYKFTVPNLSSILFLLPFFFFSIIASRKKNKLNFILIFAFLFGISILSGRRAIVVCFVFGSFLAYIISGNLHKFNLRQWKRKTIFAIFISALIYYILNKYELLNFYLTQIESTFNFEENASNKERSLQFNELIDGIINAPFFGNGAGAAAGYLRSDTQAWTYELSYVALVFQCGIIGFIIYFFGIVFLINGIRKIVKKNIDEGFSLCYLAGFLSFLIANATNPYLGKYDYMWLIFIPVAMLIGLKKIERNEKYTLYDILPKNKRNYS